MFAAGWLTLDEAWWVAASIAGLPKLMEKRVMRVADDLQDMVMDLTGRTARLLDRKDRYGDWDFDMRLCLRLLDFGCVFYATEERYVRRTLAVLEQPLAIPYGAPEDTAALAQEANELLPLVWQRAILEVNSWRRRRPYLSADPSLPRRRCAAPTVKSKYCPLDHGRNRMRA